MPSRVIVALRVPCDPARAFDVFTREIGAWWQPSDLFQVTPKGDGVLSFEGDGGGRLITTCAEGQTFEIGRVLEWRRGERLRFTWRQAGFRPEQSTEVDVRFEDVTGKEGDDETRVTVEHIGWDMLPQEHVARHGFPLGVFLQRTADWWRGSLAALKHHIT
jgi:uncharacterized protein YndB with AHSA1/START domain